MERTNSGRGLCLMILAVSIFGACALTIDGTTPSAPPVVSTTSDAGADEGSDSRIQPDAAVTDAGSVTTDAATIEDASTDAIVLLADFTENGTNLGVVLRGSMDQVTLRANLTAYAPIEFRRLPVIFAGVSDSVVMGSLGTPLFGDIKLKNLVTGQVMMGPLALPSTLVPRASSSGVLEMTDSFALTPMIMMPGAMVSAAVTFDVARDENVRGEFFNGRTFTIRLADGAFGPTDVRLITTGQFLDPSMIRVIGNTSVSFVVQYTGLVVSLASAPTSSTANRNGARVPSAGYVFTASPTSAIRLNQATLQGVGDVDGIFDGAHLQDVVTACGWYDGAVQIGQSFTPDEHGIVPIPNMNYTIPRGQSRTLVVWCNTDSVVNQATGDRYAIGLNAIDATDEDGNHAIVDIGASARQYEAGTPSVIITVAQSR